MGGFRGIHWVPPTSMVGFFLTSIIFAVGHHIFYSGLAGSPAPSTTFEAFGFNISAQEVNIAIGTALALFSKTGSLLAVSIVYVQGFWRAATRATRRMTLADLDTMSMALDDVTAFSDVFVWLKHPLLLSIAVIAWLLPIPSIITPAMLSVEIKPVSPPPMSLVNVPNLDFNTMEFLAPMILDETGTLTHTEENNQFLGWKYMGPHQEVQRIASAVASGGNILPIEPPEANSTWEVQFDGPSIACDPFEGKARRKIQCQFLNGVLGQLAWGSFKNFSESDHLDSAFTLTMHGKNFSYEIPNLDFQFRDSKFAFVSTSFYIVVQANNMTFPGFEDFDPISSACHKHVADGADLPKIIQDRLDHTSGNFMQCQLFNSSYNVAFDFTNGGRAVSTDVVHHERIDAHPGKLDTVVQPALKHFPDFIKDLNFTDILRTHKLNASPKGVQRMSYTAILDAFSSLLSGVIQQTGIDTQTQPNVAKTALMQHSELQFLQHQIKNSSKTLQDILPLSNDSLVRSLRGSPHASAITDQPLHRAVEEMFQNMTVSFMSSDFLRAKNSSTFAPPPSKVTFNRFHAVYAYSSSKLWLAYGFEIGFSLIIVLVGVFLFLSNEASFSNNFSSILRSAQNAKLDVEIKECDMTGKDPLPGYLSRATTVLPGFDSRPSRQASLNEGRKGSSSSSTQSDTPVVREPMKNDWGSSSSANI